MMQVDEKLVKWYGHHVQFIVDELMNNRESCDIHHRPGACLLEYVGRYQPIHEHLSVWITDLDGHEHCYAEDRMYNAFNLLWHSGALFNEGDSENNLWVLTTFGYEVILLMREKLKEMYKRNGY